MTEVLLLTNMLNRTMHSVKEEFGPSKYGSVQKGLVFRSIDGAVFNFYHQQDCSETVEIESIEGDLKDLIGTPLLAAEMVTGESSEREFHTQTWTFLKFATIKGYVTVRWLGQSNGYYSETPEYAESFTNP